MNRTKCAAVPEPASSPRLLCTVKEAASILGVSYCHARRLILAGILPRVKMPSAKTGGVSRRLLVDLRDVLACIAAWKGGRR